MNTIEAAKGNWAVIFNHFKLPGITGKRHYKDECPACKRKGKFRCDDKYGNGDWICSCGKGTGFDLLRLVTKKDFKTLAAEVDQIIGRTFVKGEAPKKVETDTAELRKKVTERFQKLKYLRGTDGESYLKGRGINVLPAEAIRFEPSQKTHGGKVMQALWSMATDAKGQLCYLHRTLLDDGKKALREDAKKMTRMQEQNYCDHAESVAVRMFPVDTTLGIAEGIETALSCRELYKFNVWSVLNTSLMKRFKVPMGVKKLIIFADSDWHGAGHAAAFHCANINILDRSNDLTEVKVVFPDSGDFNDVLLNNGNVREINYIKKVAA
ncbi:DNA primase [Enterobacterales bacterium CwR94]|nr:DNA primase [Enterobacterales bacterium CwR94]